MFVDLLIDIGRDLLEMIQVFFIVVRGARLVAQVVANIGPECRVAVERHLPVLEALVGHEIEVI